MRQPYLLTSLLALVLLAACGGNSSDSASDSSSSATSLSAAPPTPVPIPQDNGEALTQLDPATFATMLRASAPGLMDMTGEPLCSLRIYSIKYPTKGGAFEDTEASAAIMVPSGSDTKCSGPRPVLLYAHGTTVEKAFNMAKLRDNAEASLVAAMFAAQGYIVVAPNYAGYDISTLPYHPFLNAAQQATDMMGALRKARTVFKGLAADYSDKLFLAGYSQGGHVAMATQRAMQIDTERAILLNKTPEFVVTALAGMSGPYAMAMLGDVIFNGSPNLGGTVFLPMTATSWQKAYGDLYATPGEVYEDQYVTGIESLIPSTSYTYSGLFAANKLPEKAVFAKDSLPAPSSPDFAPYFGDNNLVKSSFRTAYVSDVQKNPCDVNPARPLNCSPASAFRKAAIRNDLRTYVPTVPVMLCGGHEDPTVFFSSTEVTATYFRRNDMPDNALTVLDVDSDAIAPYATIKKAFSLAKAATKQAATIANKDPDEVVTNAYHGYLVPPFCNAAARSFFAAVP